MRDLARLRAAVKLSVPERILPALEASERALPADPDASARLAAAYAVAQRPFDAIAADTAPSVQGRKNTMSSSTFTPLRVSTARE